MPRRSSSSAAADKVVRLPGRGRPRGANRAPVGIQSVDIALAILEGVSENGFAISLTALSRKTGLQPSKLHRYLVSFTRRGLLTQAPVTGLYDLGPYARRLGMAALNRFDEMGHAHQAVTMLSAKTGYTVAIYVWTDLGPALVRLEMGAHALPVTLRVGSAIPLCASATGRVFLAYLPTTLTQPFVERERRAALAEGDPAPDGPALDAAIDKIRTQRIYWTHNAIIPGLAVVAPVFDAHGDLFCTLTGLAPRGYADEKHRADLIENVGRAAADLSREFFGAPMAPSLQATPNPTPARNAPRRPRRGGRRDEI